MSDRTDLVYKALATDLKAIEDAITDIKNKQNIGTDSIYLYRNLSPVGAAGGFDIDYTYGYGKNWSVLFTGDNLKAPFCELSLETYINGRRVNESELQRFDSGDMFFNTLVSDYLLVYSNRDPATGGSMGWYFYTGPVVGGTVFHVQVRLVVNANDTGTVSVQAI